MSEPVKGIELWVRLSAPVMPSFWSDWRWGIKHLGIFRGLWLPFSRRGRDRASVHLTITIEKEGRVLRPLCSVTLGAQDSVKITGENCSWQAGPEDQE